MGKTQLRTMIQKDIDRCDELLKVGKASYEDVQQIVGKYIIDIPNFRDGLHNYAVVPGTENNEIKNISIVKSKLEYLLHRDETQVSSFKKKGSIFNYSPSNTINNSNTVQINMTIEDIRKNVENNTYLGESEKDELLSKLNEIEDLQKSNKSKNDKWKIAKDILKFVLDKGADIAIMYIPQILMAIK